jgi:hypothetical protein
MISTLALFTLLAGAALCALLDFGLSWKTKHFNP